MEVKAALRRLWHDSCDIVEYEEYVRDNKSVGHREVTVLENLPCKLSFEALQGVSQTETAAGIGQRVTLFLEESIAVKAGSKVIITRKNGMVFVYQKSGEPGVFTHHQEIPLSPWEEWA